MGTSWTVEFTRGGACGPHYMLSDKDGCFARLYQEHGNDDEALSLIAAAPALLEALDDILMAYDLPGDHCEMEQAIIVARAAIDKAKGEK